MSNTPDGVFGRLRHYVTLIIQIVPCITLAVNISPANGHKFVLLLLPLLLASVGPVLELSGRRVGRALTLTGLGLQVVALLVLLAAILISGAGELTLTAGNLAGLALIVGLILVPGGLFVWNLRAGRAGQPVLTKAA